jgi:hypothetical protein
MSSRQNHERLLVAGYRGGTWYGGWPHLTAKERGMLESRIGTVWWQADFFGTNKMGFSATRKNTGTTWSFNHFSKAIKEIIGARVWGDIHFRKADVAGWGIAKKIARRRERNYFQPVGE